MQPIDISILQARFVATIRVLFKVNRFTGSTEFQGFAITFRPSILNGPLETTHCGHKWHPIKIIREIPFMTWNNRIFKHVANGRICFALHETYYDETTGNIKGWTEQPVSEFSGSIEELIEDLEQKLNDAKKFRDAVLIFDAPEGKDNQ